MSLIANTAKISDGLLSEISAGKFSEITEQTEATHAKIMTLLETEHGPLPAVGVCVNCQKCANYDHCETAEMIRRWRLRVAKVAEAK